MQSVVQQAADCMHKHIRTIDEYLEVRRDTIRAKLSFAILETGLENLIDEAVCHPVINKLSILAIDMILLGNVGRDTTDHETKLTIRAGHRFVQLGASAGWWQPQYHYHCHAPQQDQCPRHHGLGLQLSQGARSKVDGHLWEQNSEIQWGCRHRASNIHGWARQLGVGKRSVGLWKWAILWKEGTGNPENALGDLVAEGALRQNRPPAGWRILVVVDWKSPLIWGQERPEWN